MAGPQGREGDAGLFLQADRDRGQNERRRARDAAHSDAAHVLGLPRLPNRRHPCACALRLATKTVPERIEDVEIIVEASGVPVRIGGDRAFYSPALDFIQMPPDEAFHSPELRAATFFHELAHASGHVSRLKRDLSGGFGSVSYAKEELRAELASYAIGSMIGLPCDVPNHASYIQSWIGVLKQDRREIFHAAAEAQRIADYILAFHPDYAEKPAPPRTTTKCRKSPLPWPLEGLALRPKPSPQRARPPGKKNKSAERPYHPSPFPLPVRTTGPSKRPARSPRAPLPHAFFRKRHP